MKGMSVLSLLGSDKEANEKEDGRSETIQDPTAMFKL